MTNPDDTLLGFPVVPSKTPIDLPTPKFGSMDQFVVREPLRVKDLTHEIIDRLWESSEITIQERETLRAMIPNRDATKPSGD